MSDLLEKPKDLHTALNERITNLLSSINETQLNLWSNAELIDLLKRLIQRLYIEIESKTTTEEKSIDEEFQTEINQLQPINNIPTKNGNINSRINIIHWKKMQSLLEKREIHIRRIITRLGIEPRTRHLS